MIKGFQIIRQNTSITCELWLQETGEYLNLDAHLVFFSFFVQIRVIAL